MLVKIADITIGDRYRHELGDIEMLAQSIAEVGLLHPIVITPDRRLIAGARRIEAHRLLGLDAIEATVIDLADTVKGEFAENEHRKDFTWSERVEIAKAIEPIERTAAKQRMEAGIPSESFTEGPGQALDKVAAAVGTSRPTLKKATEVYDSGHADLIAMMDTRSVERAHIELKRRQIREQARQAPDLPIAKYRVWYADPPWSYGNTMPEGRTQPSDYYPLMPLDDICALPVTERCEENAVLFLWATSPMLPEALRVISSWGFEYKTSFVWDKIKHNMGHYNSVRHEFLLVCVRGSCQPDVHKLFDSVVSIERTEHSVKPEYFREIIDTIYPEGRRIELFARTRATGWDVWGNQV